MRVILEVSSGPDAGRKTVLGAGQVLQVGRTEWADFTIPHDGHLSGIHFAVETDKAACYIKDLGSSNGTLLNGQPVLEKAVLRDGDEIRAGSTLFTIRTEGGTPDEAAIPASRAAAGGLAAAPGPSAVPASRDSLKVCYTVETCDSGLTLYRGIIDEIQPQELAALLSRTYPLHLIVDFRNLGIPLPDDLGHPDYLFDWFEPDAAAMVSPVVLSQDDTAAWPTLVAEGWGNDAVICLFTKQDKPALLDHLRRSIRTKPKRGEQGGGIVGYCWPSVMAPLLSNYRPDFVRELLTGIDAVLVELPDLPLTWQVYGSSQVADVLDRLGFALKPAEEVTSQQSEDRA